MVHLWDEVRDGHEHQLNQEWLWNGQLLIPAKAPGKCLHLVDGKTSNGTKIHVWDMGRSGLANQEWALEGGYIISLKDKSKCLHLVDGNTSNGTKLHLWNGHMINSKWQVKWLDGGGGGEVEAISAEWLDSAKVLNANEEEKYSAGFQDSNSNTASNSQKASVSVKVSGGIPFGAEAEFEMGGELSQAASHTASISTSKGKDVTIKGPGKVFYLVVNLSNGDELYVTHRTQADGSTPDPLTPEQIAQALRCMRLQ